MTKISRRSVLKGGMAVLAASRLGPAFATTPSALPNILWFVSEDNYPVIGAYGDELANTPTIDKLAKEGVLYEHAYCVSPVCGPSRFSILTGMHPESAGTPEDFGSTDEVLPPWIRGYPSYFRDLGYYCTNHAKKNYNSQFDNVKALWDESSEQAHWKNRPEGQPFFAVFNTFTTHESALFRSLKGKVTPEMVEVPPYLPDTPGVRQDFATFYNAMEKMDGELAAHLAELEEAGVADDTIVFYYSDNGGITPRGKRYCYELGMRCALVAYVPPKWAHLMPHSPGTKVTEPVSFNDLMPTVLSLVGIAPPSHVQGRPLLGEFHGPAPSYIFGGRNRMDSRYDLIRTATDTRFRYIRNYSPHRIYAQHNAFMFQARGYQDWEAEHLAERLNDVQERFWQRKPYEELYDFQTDPHEINDLAGDPAWQDKLQEMRVAMDEHMIAINDNGLIPEGCTLQGYINSRRPGAYPLPEIMALAARAAQGQAEHLETLVEALDFEHEVMRYWGAQGLLIAGEKSMPFAARMKTALLNEQSVAVRISLAESLVNLTNDHDALRELGFILDTEDDGPFRMQAINALTYVGERARPVLPAIRRSAQEDHRSVRSAALYLVSVLDGTYEPHRAAAKESGYNPVDPEVEGEAKVRYYD